jgi:hypothetical protein
MKTRFAAERLIDAPAEVIYHCLADYRHHHRPGEFLLAAFRDQEVDHGGIGAGTELSYVVAAGGRRRPVTAIVTEPEPGRTLVETGSGFETTSTVEPADGGTRVRFETAIDE